MGRGRLSFIVALAALASACGAPTRLSASSCVAPLPLVATTSIAALRPNTGRGSVCARSDATGTQALTWADTAPAASSTLTVARGVVLAGLAEAVGERHLAWYGRCPPITLQREPLAERIAVDAAEHLPWPAGRPVVLAVAPTASALTVIRVVAALEARGVSALLVERAVPRQLCLDERPGDRARKQSFTAVGGAIATIAGDLSELDVTSVIRTTLPELQRCYEYQLVREPKAPPSGKVVVRFTVDRTGTVAQVVVAETTLRRPLVESCLTDAVKELVFPPPRGRESAVVTYPFVFKVKRE